MNLQVFEVFFNLQIQKRIAVPTTILSFSSSFAFILPRTDCGANLEVKVFYIKENIRINWRLIIDVRISICSALLTQCKQTKLHDLNVHAETPNLNR